MGQGHHIAKTILLTQGVSRGRLGLDGTMVQDDPRTTHQQGVRRSFLETSTLSIFCKHFCLRRPQSHPTTPLLCAALCHHRVPGEGARGAGMWETQVRGRRGPQPPGGRGPLCTDVSCLGGKREGKFPWAICTLEQSKNWMEGLLGQESRRNLQNQWQDEGG